MNIIEWLEGTSHKQRKGHWPVWYNLGAGQRQCVNCLKGGNRSRLFRPLRRLIPNPMPI